MNHITQQTELSDALRKLAEAAAICDHNETQEWYDEKDLYGVCFYHKNARFTPGFRAFARAIEQAHGIGAAKP